MTVHQKKKRLAFPVDVEDLFEHFFEIVTIADDFTKVVLNFYFLLQIIIFRFQFFFSISVGVQPVSGLGFTLGPNHGTIQGCVFCPCFAQSVLASCTFSKTDLYGSSGFTLPTAS